MVGASIDWPAFHREFKPSLSLLDLPKYSFEDKEFWAAYPDPGLNIAEVAQASQSPKSQATAPSVQGYLSTSLQRVLRETIQADGLLVTFESDLADQNLRAAVRGHAVAGVEMCSSSLLMDMALSAAQYAYLKHARRQTMPTPLTIRDCHFNRGVALTEQAQTLEVTVSLSWSNKTADIRYHCRTPDEHYELGTCQVAFGTASKPVKAGFLVRSRMAALKQSAGHQLGKHAVYRLFDNIVRYSEQYQGLGKVYLSEDLQDALAEVNMANVPAGGGHYLYQPFLLDSIVHVSGFVVNNGLRFSSETACLSTGFQEWHLLKPLDRATVYTTYTFMEDSSPTSNLVTGDVYVFDGDDLASVLIGVQYQKMKRTVLAHLLSPSSGRETAHKASAPTPSGLQTKALSSVYDVAQPVKSCEIEAQGAGSAIPGPPATARGVGVDGPRIDLVETLFSIVAREVGVDPSDFTSDINLANLGVDSLMAITIISSMQQETGVELPGTFFLDHSTTTEVTAAIAAYG